MTIIRQLYGYFILRDILSHDIEVNYLQEKEYKKVAKPLHVSTIFAFFGLIVFIEHEDKDDANC